MRSASKFRLVLVLTLSCFGVVGPVCAQPVVSQAEIDAEVLAELNFARAHPQDYARRLLLEPVSAWEAALGDQEADDGARAEAIEFLMRQAPLPPLASDVDLQAAAREHVSAQGETGEVGHNGPRGERFDARLRRHGAEGEILAENIAYGPRRPSDVVRELIIDRGVPSRGHRRNIFNPDLAEAGVDCGPHRTYDSMCVIDFSSTPPAPQIWREAALAPNAGGVGSMLRWLGGR